jgi:hypothetical protein
MSKIFKWVRNSIVLSIAICSGCTLAFSQDHQPPIPVELFFGHKAISSQIVIARDFRPDSKLSFFGLSSFSAAYDTDQNGYSMFMINQLSYSIGKGFGIMAGAEMNSEVGLVPVIGPKHVYVSSKVLAVSILSYAVNGGHDLSFFGLYEFTPPINEKLSVFTGLQVLYSQSLREGHHNSSFLYIRAGLKMNRFSYGFAANLEQHGPDKSSDQNYGAFLRWDF